jgi:NAD(P)-dependent dehydrogenase (short-subunit alcohol dehydrogenase family)
MKRVLITGANRGIGLEFARQMLGRGDRVFAAARNPKSAKHLIALSAEYGNLLTIITLDVSDAQSIDVSWKEIHRHIDALDILINNAGISPNSPDSGGSEKLSRLGTLDMQAMVNILLINSVGPIIIAQQYLDLLRNGNSPKLVNITSQLGSLTRRNRGHGYGYSASKAALNMLMRILSFDVIDDGIISVLMHPGWVKTRIGTMNAPLEPEESIRGMLKVIDGLTIADTGRYLSWNGEEIPW